MNSNVRTRSAIAALLALAAGAQAQVITGTLSNFDVWNRTGQTANDFHVRLGGIPTTAIGGLYTGNYPAATVGALPPPGGTQISWTGSATAPNQKAHFGFTLPGNLTPNSVQFQWTFNGNVIGNIPDASQIWRQLLTNRIQDVIVNNSTATLWIQRRVNTIPSAVVLNDLLVTSPIWTTASIIDPAPIPLSPGSEATWDFIYAGQPLVNFVMMYDVLASQPGGGPGQPLVTFLNAATVPAPGTIALALVGVVAMRRRR